MQAGTINHIGVALGWWASLNVPYLPEWGWPIQCLAVASPPVSAEPFSECCCPAGQSDTESTASNPLMTTTNNTQYTIIVMDKIVLQPPTGTLCHLYY